MMPPPGTVATRKRKSPTRWTLMMATRMTWVMSLQKKSKILKPSLSPCIIEKEPQMPPAHRRLNQHYSTVQRIKATYQWQMLAHRISQMPLPLLLLYHPHTQHPHRLGLSLPPYQIASLLSTRLLSHPKSNTNSLQLELMLCQSSKVSSPRQSPPTAHLKSYRSRSNPSSTQLSRRYPNNRHTQRPFLYQRTRPPGNRNASPPLMNPNRGRLPPRLLQVRARSHRDVHQNDTICLAPASISRLACLPH